MGKQEVLQILKEQVGFASKKEAEEFLDKIDLVFETIAKDLEVNQKAKLGTYMVIEKKFKEEKSGEINGKPYVTPAHNAIKVKATKAVKELE